MSTRGVPCLLLVLAIAGCSSRGYQREGGKWAWVWYGGEGRQVRRLTDARGSLSVLSNANYAATEENVYLWGVQLPDADPDTLELLTYPYARDSARVYCGSVPISGAEPNKFRILGGLLDPNYVSTAHAFEKVVGPFDTVPRDAPIVAAQGWATDEKNCFFGPSPIAGADPASFVVLNDWYAKDAKRVYFGHRTVPEADVASFRVTHYMEAEDERHTYSKWEIVEK
jgi:hypothetical protein